MRGFYRISSGVLLGLLSGLLHAQLACEDLRHSQRELSAELSDDNALHADAAKVDLKAYGVSRLSGGVRLHYGRQALMADELQYDQPQRHLQVDGETFFESDELQVQAQSADIMLDQGALFRDAQYVTYAAGARGEAGELEVLSSGQAALRNVRYTTCPAGQEDWVLEGDEILLDSARGMGSAKNVRLRFKGVPLLWLPRFFFPVGEQRQSGFLSPRIGDNDSAGLDISLPYYLNLAPNYDLTLTPRHMARRGEQASLELRYLWSHSSGRSQVEFLDKDEQSGDQRYPLSTSVRGGSQGHWFWEASALKVSDGRYFSDLGSSEADEAQSFLPRYAVLAYRNPESGLRASLSASNYQSLLDAAAPESAEYSRLPELRLRWRPAHRGRVQPRLKLSAVNFTRDNAIEAWRGDAQFGLNWRMDRPQGFLANRVDYRYTSYELREHGQEDKSLHRALPSLQSSAGLYLHRQGRNGRYQTLSPQLHYLFVPYRDQDEIPLFDTNAPDFSFDQLFASNRYTGIDRIADANLLTTALRTDWYRNHGQQRALSAKLGVQWRVERSQVSLPNEALQDAGSSDWLGELDFQPNSAWRLQLTGQWNASKNQMSQGVAAARFQPRGNRFVQLSYRFRRDNFEQADALASLPLNSRWRVAGRWTYSLQDERSLEALGGLEYRSCCWAAQLAWRRYLDGDGDAFNSTLYLQLELNGLGKIGDGLDSLLQRDIL